MKAYALIAAFLCITAMAAESTIQLPKPQIPGKSNLQELLQNRQSTRVFDDEPLSEQQLANLLWSAYGVNRDDGKLTVPAALNRHAFTLYLLTAQGVMQYDNKNGTLTEVLDKDIRAMAEGRKTLGPAAGATVLLVADTTTFNDIPGNGDFMLGVEAGAICQNIYLYAASEGLNALCAGSLDAAGIAEALSLPATRRPFLTMILGKKPVR